MEIIIPLAAIVILWLLFTWSIKVFQASIKTMLIIAAIFLILQIGLGINSEQIIQEIMKIINYVEQLIFGN